MFRPLFDIRVLIALVMISFSAGNAASDPFHHKFGELREYHKHWLAVCPDKHDPSSKSDYQRTCWASTTPHNEGFFFSQRLSVSRDRTTGELGIRFVAPEWENIDKAGMLTVRFSGDRTWSGYWADTIKKVTANEFQVSDETIIIQLISHMRRANWMVIEIPMRNGTQSLQFSTIGLNASMKFMEEYAGREK